MIVRFVVLTLMLTLVACAQDMRAAGNRTMTVQYDTYWNAIGGAGNLGGYLANLDRQMADDRVQIPSRPVEALQRITKEFSVAGAISDDGFSKAVVGWFRDRYGDRLELNTTIGSLVVLIAETPYRVDFPLSYRAGFVSPLRFITSATPALFQSMTKDEVTDLVNLIGTHYQGAIRSSAFLAGTEHHTAAVDHIVEPPQNLNLGKYESMLSVELALQDYITRKGGTVETVHDLKRLEDQAVALGLPPLPAGLTGDVRCTSEVRDGVQKTPLREAVLAVQSASTIRTHISNAL